MKFEIRDIDFGTATRIMTAIDDHPVFVLGDCCECIYGPAWEVIGLQFDATRRVSGKTDQPYSGADVMEFAIEVLKTSYLV